MCAKIDAGSHTNDRFLTAWPQIMNKEKQLMSSISKILGGMALATALWSPAHSQGLKHTLTQSACLK